MLQWDTRYEVGNARIDSEHRIFLSLINDFQEARNQQAPQEKMLRILTEVAKYAEFHFTSEENIMADSNYPEMAEHAQHHAHLMAELRNKRAQFSEGSLTPGDIFDFLFQWFAFHTTTEDKKLVAFLNK